MKLIRAYLKCKKCKSEEKILTEQALKIVSTYDGNDTWSCNRCGSTGVEHDDLFISREEN